MRGVRKLSPYHNKIGITQHFGAKAKLQPTWEKLIRIYLGYSNLPSDTESVRKFQSSKFGSKDCGFASLELFPLPSVNTDTWIYRQVKAIPFLINREVYKYYIYPRRAEELKRRISIHKPKFVIIYGLDYRHEWEGIIGQELLAGNIAKVLTASFENTRIAVIPHPVSYGHKQDYWANIGKQSNV